VNQSGLHMNEEYPLPDYTSKVSSITPKITIPKPLLYYSQQAAIYKSYM